MFNVFPRSPVSSSTLQELSRHFTLRVLLCHVDVDDSETPLLEINKMAVLNDFTLVLAWSLQVKNQFELTAVCEL